MFLLGLLAAEGPITFGTTQGGSQAMILLHMLPYSLLFIITMWVAINGTGVKSVLAQVPPLMLGPVVFINSACHYLLTLYCTQSMPTLARHAAFHGF